MTCDPTGSGTAMSEGGGAVTSGARVEAALLGKGVAAPSVRIEQYVVYPTGYDEMVHSDKDSWCLVVTNGHRWGWRITRGRGMSSPAGMNRKGEFIYESRASGHNARRRWSLDEAIGLACKHVDTLTINGFTAQQASDSVAARQVAS